MTRKDTQYATVYYDENGTHLGRLKDVLAPVVVGAVMLAHEKSYRVVSVRDELWRLAPADVTYLRRDVYLAEIIEERVPGREGVSLVTRQPDPPPTEMPGGGE